MDHPGFNGAYIGIAFLILTVYLTAICLATLFTRVRKFFLASVLISIVPVLFFFGYTWPIITAMTLFILACHIAFGRVQDELANRLNVRVPVLVREGLPLILTGLSLLIAVAYFSRVEVSAPPTIEDIFPRTVFNRIIRGTSPIIWNRILPGFDTSLTIDEYITERLKETGVNIEALPEKERILLLTQARTQVFGNASHPVHGNQRIDDVLYDIVISRSNSYVDPYRQLLPIGLALAFFLFLRTVAFPYGWLLTLIVWSIIQLGVSKGWIVRVEEHVLKERLFW